MAKINNIEAEIDAIRDEIREETKYLTEEERAKQLREKVKRLADQYGFKIVKSTSERPNAIPPCF